MSGVLKQEDGPATNHFDIRDFVDDPHQIDEDLQAFRKTAMHLSSHHPRMIELYPQKWIVLHAEEVKAHGDTLESVLEAADSQGLPRGQVIVRFINTEPRTLIL